MKFKIGNEADVRVVLLWKTTEFSHPLFDAVVASGVFNNKKKETYFDYQPTGTSTLFLGLGEEDALTLDDMRNAFHIVGKKLTQYKVTEVAIDLSLIRENQTSYLTAAVEGLLQSQSVFDTYLTKKTFEPTLETVFVNAIDGVDVLAVVASFEHVFEGIELTRTLVNERANVIYPETLAQRAKAALEPVGVKVTVLNKQEIEALGMDAFLAVNLGSTNEPRFIIMEYTGDPASQDVTAFVGKGVTYDTGGYSLKPSTSMDTMFTDMGGAGSVIGSMLAIAKAKLPKNVTALVAATENKVNGSAFVPGDIIGSMSKKTIEVLNTDAEGRLTLADALWYAHDVVEASRIIDLATLTGACIVALGTLTTAAITNDADMMDDLLLASVEAGEPIWQMPTNDSYRDMVTSDFADLVNTSRGVGAGTITAGLFLEHFVNKTPWVHLDIAGTAYTKQARGYLPQGATGVHVKTLFNYIRDL